MPRHGLPTAQLLLLLLPPPLTVATAACAMVHNYNYQGSDITGVSVWADAGINIGILEKGVSMGCIDLGLAFTVHKRQTQIYKYTLAPLTHPTTQA